MCYGLQMVDEISKKLITQADFSVEAKVSRAAVSKAATRGLKAAMVDDRIDIAHPDAQAYIKRQQDKKTKKTPVAAKPKPPAKRKGGAKSKPKPPAKEPAPAIHFSEDKAIAPYMDWTLRELIRVHGSSAQFKRYTDSVKVLADIRNKDLKSAELEGTLIPRAIVKTHLFGAIENNNLRLLTDMPKTITRRLDALIKSGSTVEDCETVVRELLSAHIKGVKAAAKRILKNV